MRQTVCRKRRRSFSIHLSISQEKFIQTAYKYVGINKLDGYALRELVSAIYADAPNKSSGKRVQYIHIKYDGLGFIPLNELMKEETA